MANKKSPQHSVEDIVDQSVSTVAAHVQDVERRLDAVATPVRERVLRRFPILFTLLTTFGVTAVFLGFERILSEINFLHQRPWLILSLGIVTLLLTGTLYKVLDRSQK